MIPGGVEIFLATTPIDLRWGFARLTGVVTELVGREVRSGALFLFLGKRRDALKILFFDGSGLCLFYKRLDDGLFRRPIRYDDPRLNAVEMSESDLNALLDGIDLQPSTKRRRQGRPSRKKLH